jgi:hypothetical protein
MKTPMHRGWTRTRASAALGALGFLAATPAAAADPPACALASVIGELTVSEERSLTRACEGAEAPEADLQGAIFHMVSLSGWRSAALARLLAPLRSQGPRIFRRGDAAAPDLARAQASLVLRPEALAGPHCADSPQGGRHLRRRHPGRRGRGLALSSRRPGARSAASASPSPRSLRCAWWRSGPTTSRSSSSPPRRRTSPTSPGCSRRDALSVRPPPLLRDRRAPGCAADRRRAAGQHRGAGDLARDRQRRRGRLGRVA